MPFRQSSPKLLLLILPLLVAVPLTLASVARAQPAPKRTLLALSKTGRTLAIVDPATLKIDATVPVGPAPHEVVASADGNTAYVSNFNGIGYPMISVVDLVRQRALPPIDTGALQETHGLAFAGGELWFTAQGSKAVARYNPAARKIDWIMGTGQDFTHMLYVAPDEKHVYTANRGSGTVTIMDRFAVPSRPDEPGGASSFHWRATLIRVGRGDEGFDVSPDGKELWTANAQDHTLSVIDLVTRKVVDTIHVNIVSSNRLKFTPNGKYALVSDLHGPDLAVVDVATRKQIKQIPIGHGAAGILMDPVGHRAFIACTPDNYIVILDLKTFKVTGRLHLGGPDGMAWAIRQ